MIESTEAHRLVTCHRVSPPTSRAAALDATVETRLAQGSIACPACRTRCRPAITPATFDRVLAVTWSEAGWQQSWIVLQHDPTD